ncbi:MAG: hypothetical protein Q7S29_03840 [Candidatus Peribacter sp.]|nr:hypothetical protein [Candidatus Peribacter sp.]
MSPQENPVGGELPLSQRPTREEPVSASEEVSRRLYEALTSPQARPQIRSAMHEFGRWPVLSAYNEGIVGSARRVALRDVHGAPHEGEPAGKAFDGLRKLEQAQRLSTEVFLPPEGTRSFASLIIQKHHKEKGDFDPSAKRIAQHLFHTLHTLTATPDQRIFTEGFVFMREGLKIENLPNPVITGTDVCASDDEGQQLLLSSPGHLERFLEEERGRMRGNADQAFILWKKATINGVEPPEHHEQTGRELTMVSRGRGAAKPYEGMLGNLLHVGGTISLKPGDPTKVVMQYNGMAIQHTGDLATMIADFRRYCDATELFASMNRRREADVLDRIAETITEGKTPHVVYGASHAYELLKNCMQRGIGLFLSIPQEWEPSPMDPFFYADEKNAVYQFISKTILPRLEQLQARRA